MNFSTVSLLSLLSITSLVTSPASGMRVEETEELDEKPPSVTLSARSEDDMGTGLDLTSLATTFQALRTTGNEASNEELASYLLRQSGVDWDARTPNQKNHLVARVSGQPLIADPSEGSDLGKEGKKTTRSIADIDKEIEKSKEKIKLLTPLIEAAEIKLAIVRREHEDAKAKMLAITEPEMKAQQEDIIRKQEVSIDRTVKSLDIVKSLVEAGNNVLANLIEEKESLEK